MSERGLGTWKLLAAVLILGGALIPLYGRAPSPPGTAPEKARVGHPPHRRAQWQSEPGNGIENSGQITPKQRRAFMKENLEKMKRDAEELATLAKSLQEELEKASENVLSLQIVDKAEKIEKLAKKIKGTARGF